MRVEAPLSAGLGLLPLALVTLFGLLSSTIRNLVVLPALYLRFGGRR